MWGGGGGAGEQLLLRPGLGGCDVTGRIFKYKKKDDNVDFSCQ